MNSITAIIADDEPLLRHHLDKSLSEVWPDLEIVATCGDGKQALEKIAQYTPDIVFLDIRMPELDGMAVAKQLVQLEQQPLVVFVTAFDQYAINAFEQNALDYLLKPINEERLEHCCQKLQQHLHAKSNKQAPDINHLLAQISQLTPKQQQYLRWIKAAQGDDIHLISTNDVLYFKAEEKYVSIYTDESEYLIRTPIKELLQQLDPDLFWKIHRSTVVRVAAIDKVTKDFTGRMYVKMAGHKLAVSRAQQGLFKGM